MHIYLQSYSEIAGAINAISYLLIFLVKPKTLILFTIYGEIFRNTELNAEFVKFIKIALIEKESVFHKYSFVLTKTNVRTECVHLQLITESACETKINYLLSILFHAQ